MERQYVQSSNINSVGYDQESQILEIEFKHGSVYQYYGVPEHEYDNLIGATSVGSYHAQHIKGNYQYQKI